MSTFSPDIVPDGPAVTPSSAPDTEKGPSHKVVKYPYIDALRGYAVLIVILSHTGGMFPELPYPIKKLTNLGWCGVQLFFLVSCVTLMMSWRSDERKGIASSTRFWIRRYFRIAPMYYLAALFYLFTEPPDGGFDLRQMLASLTFINAWHPVLLSTINGGWRVVPGGWSISVEFSFYMIFPLIASFIRDVRAGLMFSIFAIALALIANDVAYPILMQQYGEPATGEFLYFWLPQQLFVFAFGTMLFFAIQFMIKNGPPSWMRWRPSLLITALVAAVVIFGEHPDWAVGYWLTNPWQGAPTIFYVSIALVAIAALMAANPTNLFVNRPIRALGTVSFSAYLIHFFVVHQLAAPYLFNAAHRTGITAIFVCGLIFIIASPLTFALSWITYRFIEDPMIALGSRIAGRIQRPAPTAQDFNAA